jgi:prephenate dehydrogenase
MKTVGIAGLGLIGGSIARDLAREGTRVLGHDADPHTLRAALDTGAIVGSLGSDLAAVAEVDWLVVAVPVDRAASVLRAARPFLDHATLVTDVGSTKRSIVDAAVEIGIGARFVGSHPFTGSHNAGWNAAREGLFAGARVFLCPTAETDLAALGEAHALWTLCGAITEITTAAVHDRDLAWSSHLPQFMSSALALALTDAHIAYGDTGPAARDMLRLAASDTTLWTAIGLDNADNVTAALHRVEQLLSEIRTAIHTGDADRVAALLRTARSYHPDSGRTDLPA